MLKENRSIDQFKHRVRVRACGILENDSGILLIKHVGIGVNGILWAPPGGGVEFGEKAEEVVKREYLEETGLHISVNKYLFTNQFISKELHAIELFYSVTYESGTLFTGNDPELPLEEQIIKEARFVSHEELFTIPKMHLHNIFDSISDPHQITEISGLLTFEG